MATRLFPRVGMVEASRRARGSRDVIRIHEPSVGAPARTKGNLYLLAEVWGGAAAGRAAEQVVDEIDHAYYYDLSAGPLVALVHALEAANRRLFHERQRLAIGRGGRIAVVAAAIRDRHVHVAAIGTAAAVIVRDGRMFELPPPPEPGDEPPSRGPSRRRVSSLGEVQAVTAVDWEGELADGDHLALVSRNLASAVGVDALRAAIVDHDPADAATALADTFGAAKAGGSDGALIIQLREQPSTARTHELQPVWPDDRLAGLPDRGPLPVASSAGGAFRRADRAVDGLQATIGRQLRLILARLGAAIPHRRVAMPDAVVRTDAIEDRLRRRRAFFGMAGLALVFSVGGLVASVPSVSPTEAIPRLAVAREAVLRVQDLLATVGERVDGQDLLERDPARAEDLLTEINRELDRAAGAGVEPAELAALRDRTNRYLDGLYAVTRLREFATVGDLGTAYDRFVPGRMVAASDGSLWILDRGRGRVIRLDAATGTSKVILRAGTPSAGATPGDPWLMASAATDVVVIDHQHQAWRIDLVEQIPRPMPLSEAGAIDGDTNLLAALQNRPPLLIFNLYLVDGAAGEVRKWEPATSLPVIFPTAPTSFLTDPPDLDPRRARDLMVDVNLWLLHEHTVTRVNFGTPLSQADYSLDPPPDESVRPTLDYQLLDGVTAGERELLMVYDRANTRIVAFARANGAFIGQWLAPTEGAAAGLLDDVRGMVVPSVVDGPPVAYLLTSNRVIRVVLE